jgi:hypothetical protein
MDPRVEADGVTRAALVAQERLSLEVLDVLAQARTLQAEIDDLRKELDTSAEKDSRRVRTTLARLDEIRRALVTAEGPYPRPQLIDQVQYLYGMLDRADQMPGRDAYRRLDELKAGLERLRTTFDEAVRGKSSRD